MVSLTKHLLIACSVGQLDGVHGIKSLLEQKADIEGVDEKGDTPLILCCRLGNTEVVRYLVEQKADINNVNKTNSAAILAACMRGHHLVAELLIECKAQIDQETTRRDTALSLAVWKNQTECVLLLLSHHANAIRVDNFGDTLLTDAAKHANLVVLERLLCIDGIDVNHQNQQLETALTRAAKKPSPDAVKLLLEHKAHADLQDEHGRTALHYAAQCDDVLAICHLIVFGATVDMKDKDGITPIMLSRGECHTVLTHPRHALKRLKPKQEVYTLQQLLVEDPRLAPEVTDYFF